jgi:myo-inositol-1(or 4)-monophosphatase
MIRDDAHILETAIAAAKAGGQLALSRLGRPGYQKWKGPRDLLAGAVLDIQAGIVEVICREFPDHPLLVEESEQPQDERADPLWIVDPIDGTFNFYHGIPLFAISIGFRQAGKYRVGVVYDPNRDELFQAIVNGGAYLNDKKVRVDQFADGMDAFHAAIVGTDWLGNLDDMKRAFQLTRILAGEVQQIRTLGSPALGMCYVAAGRLNGYYGLDHLKLWDVAAASVILQEAGGALTNLDGGPWYDESEGYLATNGAIHGAMLGVLSNTRKMQQMTRELQRRA